MVFLYVKDMSWIFYICHITDDLMKKIVFLNNTVI